MFGVAMESGTKQALSPESAAAADIFDQFANAQTFKSVQGTFRLLCETLRIKPTYFPSFYPKLRSKLRSWKAQALWAKFDKRASHRCYNRGKACANVKVLIIGAGPCGLRAAIEAQLLGAKVVVIEKRDRFSRNNVLHLWPFVIHDLRNLGAKKFYGKFCAGAIDHISIRQLQCVLLKVALLLGVEIHENVAFDDVIEPPVDQSQEKIGWKALVTPRDHPLSQYEFDVLIGADGKRNTLKGFKRKEFRGKLAIAITANFINRHSEAEARVQEISGVAFIFNQKFFQDLRDHTGIDLENIVYYKDETHYFVMTAKKYSLIEKGVISNDYADTARLLAPENVSKEALFNYAREAADFSTNFQMPNLDFAVNHYGQEDVAMFDFTSMYAAESACRIVERRGHKLLQALVGDSLLEPFWPTGSGCARGFLSSLDACWMIRSYALGTMTTLQVLAERESIHRLLAQTTPENLSKDYNDYTLNPSSRYPNFNSNAVRPAQVRGLCDTDTELKDEILDIMELPKKKRKRDSMIHPDTLLNWCQRQVILYKGVTIEDMTTSWKNGLALCAIVHRYRPDLIDFHSLKEEEAEKNNQLVFDTLEREFGIHSVMTGKEMEECIVPDALSMVSYVSQIYETFRGEIPHIIRAPTVDLSPEDRPTSPSRRSPIARLSFLSRLGQKLGSKKRYSIERIERGRGLGFVMEHEKELERERADILKRIKKRRSLERDRALFILNKDAQQATLTGYKRAVTTTEDRETFSTRVKDLEEKLYGAARNVVQTSPNAPRVIGKLDRGDWNIRMLEEKLKGQKTNAKKEKEEVPKWNRDMFEDKLRAMDQRSKCEYPIEAAKYMDFDSRLQMLDKKLKEGNNLEIGQRGSNKVSAVAEQLTSILDTNRHSQPLQRSNSKPCLINTQSASETCHFCGKRVYLMERQSAQGKFFHRGCFKCECCGIALRLSSYGLATEGSYNGKFLCMHHFTMRNLPRKRQSEETRNKKANSEATPKKQSLKSSFLTPNTSDLTDSDKMRGVTPERVEFENTVEFTSEEELLSEIDEDEWTDRNFGMSANELDSTEDESDFSSDEAGDEDEEELEEAFQHSLTKDQTWKLAETWKRRYFDRRSNDNRDEDTDDEDDDEEDYDESEEEYSYEEYENEDDDESTATEGEVQDGAGEGPSECMAITPDEFERNGEVQLTVPQQMNKTMEALDYRTLKSGEETDTGSERTDSEGYTDSDTETESETPDEEGEKGIEGDEETEEEECDHKTRHRRADVLKKHSIPTIVIDEMTTKPPDEDDDAYYVTLHEQSLKAERTLEDLIQDTDNGRLSMDSFVETPEEQLCIVEEICPLVIVPSNAEETAITPDLDVCERLQGALDASLSSSVETEAPTIVKDIAEHPRGDPTANIESALKEIPSEQVRPLSALDNVHSEDQQSGKKYSSALDVATDNNISVEESDKGSSQELSVSHSDLTKPKDVSEIGRVSPMATESPTAKMMLRLKERYLLGCSDNSSEDRFSAAMDGASNGSTSKLEPVVKSFLEVISEKQKMLSQASSPSPSPTSVVLGLADSSPSSPSSLLSSSSEPSYLRIGSSSSWSKISPISPLENVTITSNTKMELEESPVLSEERDAMESSTTTLDDKVEHSNVETPECEDKDDHTNEPHELCLQTTTEDSEVTNTIIAAPDVDNVEEVFETIEKDFNEDLVAEPGTAIDHQNVTTVELPVEELSFDHIDTSFITFRKKKASCRDSDTTPTGTDHATVEDQQEVDFMELDVMHDEETVEENIPDPRKSESPKSGIDKPPSTDTAADMEHVCESSKEDSAVPIVSDEFLSSAEVLPPADVPIKEDLQTETEKDDDSLIGMFAHSSDSDTTPSLDESIYTSVDANANIPAKIGSYTGRFSERIFPFGGVGVRDSINIRKSAMKRNPMAFSLPSPVTRDAEVNKTSVDSTKELTSEFSLTAACPPSSSVKIRKVKQASGEGSAENLDEIPFADDESSHESSSPEKKDHFRAERTRFKRSLHRPLSMVETLLSSTPIEVSKTMMLPDTPIINPEMFGTPKTMMEVMDDLRQLRTVEREKARQEARERARLKSDEELGLRKVNYTNIRKKYQKPDAKIDFDIEEEANSGLRSAPTDGVEECSSSPVEFSPSENHTNHLETVDNERRGLPDSSSPDSEVFEQQSVPMSPIEPQIEEHLVPETTEDDVVSTVKSPESNSTSANSNVRSSSSEDFTNAPSTSISSSSKTDHASSYLEPDISIEEPVIKDVSTKASGTNNNANQTSSSWPKGMTGLMSRKDKSKGQKVDGGSYEKVKGKERKSFLSLFASFGKGKDDKKKEKSPSPPSTLPLQQTGTFVKETSPMSPLEGSSLKVDGTPKESKFPKLKLARSKEKAKEKRKQKYVVETPKEGSCSPTLRDTTPVSGSPLSETLIAETRPLSFTLTLKPGDITLDRHALIASMASISRQIPEKVGNGVAPQASAEDSFSDTELDNGEEKSQTSSTSGSKKTKDYSEERRKKFQKIAQRVFRQQEQKRLRTAQEIQRQLEELELKQRDLETRGVEVEKALRGEGEESHKDETDLMQEWFRLVHAKNVLVRQEQELMVKAKELELEDRHSRLQHQLHERMAIDDLKKNPDEIEEEGRILSEMLEIVEQRDNLIELLEENRQRHEEEDKDLETTMQSKGLKLLSPTRTQS